MAGAENTGREVQEVLARCRTLADYEQLAAARLDEAARAYLDGGAGNETSLRWNREAFDCLALLPRVLRRRPEGLEPGAGTRLELLGRSLAHPIIVAPIAHQRLFHPEGELETALGAGAQQALMTLSCQASMDMAATAAAGPTCRWMQLYLQPSRAATLELVRRAEAAGYEALIVTCDAPVNGVRDREMRAGFRLPSHVRPVNLEGLPLPSPRALDDAESLVLDGLMAIAPDWDDIGWLIGQTRLPLVLKGILAPEDAVRGCEMGAAAIVVSNHGGRTLDTAIAGIDALPAVVAAVDDRVPILVDGGIRRGTDVLKALALGARAVLVGRPVAHGLAVAGAAGVSHVLRLLRDELEIAMALTGCHSLEDTGPHLIARRS